MKILLLRRQRLGGTATLSNLIQQTLPEFGLSVDILDADDWIPDRTGGKTDKEVSKKLREVAKGYHLVHAFGYRCAWACSVAFGLKAPWIYTAHDMPRTTIPVFIEKLGAARTGICSSRAVKRALQEGDATNLDVILPGTPTVESEIGAEAMKQAKEALGFDPEGRLVLGLGRLVMDHGFDALANAAQNLTADVPGLRVVIAGEGPEAESLHQPGCEVVEGKVDAQQWFTAADVVVVPHRRCGFSMVAAEAMALGKPVLARETGGLAEMGVRDVSIDLFEADEDLPYAVMDLLGSSILRESLGLAARARAYERFSLRDSVRAYSELYHDLGLR